VLNLADAHTLRFVVPFTNPNNFVDLVNPGNTPMGQIGIEVYAPLAAGKAEITIYGEFKNPMLAGPTDEKPSATLLPVDTVTTRVRARRDLEPQGTEAEDMIDSSKITGNGPIARFSKATMDIGSMIGSAFPKARIITTPVSWIMSAIGSVATIFGWSKPISTQATHMNKLKLFKYMQNYNGLDTSDNLGIDADNSIVQADLFATPFDEMAFDNIVTILNYGTSFNWAVGDAVGKELLSIKVSPTCFDTIVGLGPTNNKYDALTLGYLSFVSHFFKYWNGDIKYQFRAFKTNFHSGRLRIYWHPGEDEADERFPRSESMCYSVIWDVRTQHTTCVTIPYMCNRPWIKVRSWKDLHDGQGDVYNGVLRVVVLNPLVAANSAPTTIRVNVENAGEDGFSFSCPVDPMMMPTTGGEVIPFKKPTLPTTFVADLVPQVNDDSGLTVDQAYITGTSNNRRLIDAEKLCTGEIIVSFRQLLKRFTYWQLVYGQTNAGYANVANADVQKLSDGAMRFTLFPQHFSYPPFQRARNGGVPETRFIIAKSDLVTTVSGIFAYFRGSMRLKIFFPGTNQNDHIVTCCDSADGNFNAVKDFESELAVGRTTTISRIAIDGGTEVQMPFYNNTSHQVLKQEWADPYTQAANTRVRITQPNSSFTTTDKKVPQVYRALGDDASFGFLIGVPQMQYVDYLGTAYGDP